MEFISQSNQVAKQVRLLTQSSLKARYRKTFAGFLWVVMNPIILFSAQALVFKYFLKLQISNYFLFLLSGLLPWIFIMQSLEMGTPYFQNSGTLLKSFPVNPVVYLASLILDNLINFIAAFLIVLLPLWINSPIEPLAVLFLPIPIILLTLGVVGMVWILSTMQVFWSDTRYIVSFGLNVTYFLTPIFYSRDYIPEQWRWIQNFNPFYYMIMPFRHLLFEFNFKLFLLSITQEALLVSAFLICAVLFWRKKRNEFFFYV